MNLLSPIRFRVRTLLAFVSIVAGVSAWVAVLRHNEEQRQVLVRRMIESGASVRYEYESKAEITGPPGPLFLRRIVGEQAFAKVVAVDFGTHLSDEDVNEILHWSHLRRLDIGRNQSVTPETLARIRYAPDLRILVLWGTNLDDEGLRQICSSDSIVEIDARATKVTRLDIASGTVNTQLLRLNLDHTPLGPSGLDNAGHFATLEALSVNGTAINHHTLRLLSEAKSLTSLSICNTSISDEDIPLLLGLQELQTLYIRGTDLSSQGKTKLRNTRPELQMLYFNL